MENKRVFVFVLRIQQSLSFSWENINLRLCMENKPVFLWRTHKFLSLYWELTSFCLENTLVFVWKTHQSLCVEKTPVFSLYREHTSLSLFSSGNKENHQQLSKWTPGIQRTLYKHSTPPGKYGKYNLIRRKHQEKVEDLDLDWHPVGVEMAKAWKIGMSKTLCRKMAKKYLQKRSKLCKKK